MISRTQGRVVAELRYVAGRINRVKTRDTLGALEALGLLPNYTLFDDTVTLEVNLWQPNDAYDPGDEQSRRFISTGSEYVRPASIAIRELAPGNYFYVDAHRVRIDAVDNGTEHEPAHSTWRFCPACASVDFRRDCQRHRLSPLRFEWSRRSGLTSHRSSHAGRVVD